MLCKKKGMPTEGECVFCTVTKIHFHSVFVDLDEYENKHGMIHISEISPGRIRNISDFVKEGKVIVCKVLSINKEKGHIDLSLRRVNESQRREKVEERKQEAIAENIVKSYSQLYKLDLIKTYNDLSNILLKTYDSVYLAFEDVVENDASLLDAGIDKETNSKLEPIIKERIKRKEVIISGKITLHSYEEDGVKLICNAMDKAINISDKADIKFLGAGTFHIIVIAPEYQEAEQILNDITEIIKTTIGKTNTQFEFKRD